ncbi:hypothetical protein PIGHUM_01129 [Pigmentiphaga humi]|uniref:SCP domain-containing protein n=1 Tax=Pigmentiphaga humi TaxID=2478468 RepID=A0A3P4AYB5_9BURK|nr:CAP domain-containing protein [Pigmentiphaga humi]VCU69069.1 hypothetical protein PIGHUM_01129 [Pigmentiphaga humi]
MHQTSPRPAPRPHLAVLSLSALLAACGGGDDGGAPLPSQPSIPQAGGARPITTMPASSYTGDKLAAFTHLNEARLAAGVGAVEQNAQLDAAAQAHATYQAKNYTTGHGERRDQPFFTGTNAADRARAQGYAGTMTAEIISYAAQGKPAIDSLLYSVYHLHAALDPRANQLGIGMDSTLTPGALSSTSLTLGQQRGAPGPVATIWHWPASGQTGVQPGFAPAGESPNPAPDLAVTGTPIMFCGAAGNYAPLRLLDVSLIETATREAVPLRVLKSAAVQSDASLQAQVVDDPNLTPGVVYQMCVFMLPLRALDAGARYDVGISAGQAGERLEAGWTFSTLVPD